MQRRRCSRLRLCAGGETCNYGDGVGPTFDRLTSAVPEIDPTFIKTIEHPHAGFRVSHALRAEQLIPGLALHRHRNVPAFR